MSLISKKAELAGFYATALTTKAGTVAQTATEKVTITAHVTPKELAVGRKLYFRPKDPDPDDQSPYEPDIDGGDNFLQIVGKLDDSEFVEKTIEVVTIDGEQVAVAECELLLGFASGDNFVVEASVDEGFGHICASTTTLTAWKRIYLEVDSRYVKGATVVSAFTPDVDELDNDVIHVDNVDDFTLAMPVVLFTPTVSYETTIVSLNSTTKTITVEDLPHPIPKYAGVRIVGEDQIKSPNLSHLTAAFGLDTPGADGGAFVEFVTGVQGSGSVPHYKSFATHSEAFNFAEYWFHNMEDHDNILQIILLHDHVDIRSLRGVAYPFYNIAVLYDARSADSRTTIHEIGHHFDVQNAHVDRYIAEPDHAGGDNCVMSYSAPHSNEFCKDCLTQIREVFSPL